MKYAFIFLLIIIQKNVFSQTTAKEIFQRTDVVLKGRTAIAYEIETGIKYLSEKDTTVTKAKCYAKNAPNDKQKMHYHLEEYFGYYPTRYKQIYNGDTIVNISPNDSSALIIRMKQRGAENFLYNRDIPSFISSFHIDDFYAKILEKESIIDISLSEENFNDKDCYLIKYIDKAGAKNENEYFHFKFYIDKTTYFPIGYSSTVNFEDMTQYSYYKVSNLKLNPDLSPQLFIIGNNLPPHCIRRLYNPKTYGKSETLQLVKVGNKAPDIQLKTLKDEDFDLSKYKGKTILLDFWYIGCLPCIRAQPDIQEIATKYDTSKVVVIGVNVRDAKETIIPFLEKRNLTYTNIYNGWNTAQSYGVSVYPTLIVIDGNGVISAVQEGWPLSNNKNGLTKRQYKYKLNRKIQKSMRK